MSNTNDLTNSKRRMPDARGKLFMPFSIDSDTNNEGFFTDTKLVALAILGIAAIAGFGFISRLYGAPPLVHAGLYIGFAWLLTVIFRYAILSEGYYYRLYLKMKKNRVSAPSVFWDIASVTDSQRGARVTFSDLKSGIFVRLYRGTISGKPDNFREAHYDRVSDFYKFLNENGYKFVLINVMESAANDKRLSRLDKLAANPENENLRRLMDIQISHVKAISRETLSENEYLLIYTTKERSGMLLEDAPKALSELIRNSAVSSYDILDSREIAELFKELYGVRYFDVSGACLRIFGGEENNRAFGVVKIFYKDGSVRDLAEESKKRGRKSSGSYSAKSVATSGIDGVIDLEDEGEESL
jgi:hypothetical protein